MASDDVMAPLCIILAKGGAHGGKILFKYPYLTPSHQGEPHMTRKTPYALTISEDLLNQRSKVESTNIENGSLVGFKDETLANMFAVSKALCGRKFELKFNDVRFVGHPLSLDGNESKRSPITMFHVVFALKALAPYSVVECYHELSQRLGLAVMHEEKRVGYLSSQTKCLISAQDEVAAFAEAEQEHPFSLAVDRSELARDIKQIHEELCSTGIVNRYINKWVEVAFCLPQKVHRRNFPNLMVEPESIFQCLEALRPYHALLLRVDENELLESLSTDASPALRRLVRQANPLKSFRTLAIDTDLSLMQVFQLTGHLLYWGKATVIYPLCESNVYVLSPKLPTPVPILLRNKFEERFPRESLLECLSSFSLPSKLQVSPPLALHQPLAIQMIVWMLQHHLVIQLHTYMALAITPDMAWSCVSRDKDGIETEEKIDGKDLETLPESDQENSDKNVTRKDDVMKEFKADEREAILKVPAAANVEDLNKFVKLCKYFRGEHHLEEIMYHENMRRSSLLQLIDKFREVLIKHEHEDPAITMYFKSMK